MARMEYVTSIELHPPRRRWEGQYVVIVNGCREYAGYDRDKAMATFDRFKRLFLAGLNPGKTAVRT